MSHPTTAPLAKPPTPRPWWERYPGRLEHERAELDRAYIGHRLCVDLQDEHQVIVLELTMEHDGGDIELVATFPDHYPTFRPEIQCHDVDLRRHQDPFARILCLLANSTRHWHPSDTLAGLLTAQLPKLAATQGHQPPAPGLEVAAPEPQAAHYPAWDGAALLVDGAWQLPPETAGGDLEVVYDASPRQSRIRGAVTAILSSAGDSLAEADPSMHLPIAGRAANRARVRWIRLDRPPPSHDPGEIAAHLGSIDSDLRREGRGHIKLAPSKHERWDLIGIVFPQEVRYREQGDGWLFLARRLRGKGARNGKGPASSRFDRYELIHSWPAGPGDLAERTPELAELPDRSVLQIGLGGLGRPLALQLAQAGVGTVQLLDHDVVDPATARRWDSALSAAGYRKVEVVGSQMQRTNPYSQIAGTLARLGTPRMVTLMDNMSGDAPRSECVLLAERIAAAELVVDASAEVGVQDLLATLCRERGVAYLQVSATEGGWGGLVACIRPETRGCHACLLLSLSDGTIPPPPANPAGRVHPTGCSDPTFTAAGFDLLPLVGETARTAAAALSHGLPGAYPSLDWDVATLALRDDAGDPIPAAWTGFSLRVHPRCPAGDLH